MPPLIVAAAAVACALIDAAVKRLAILDVPNERSSHSAPTARGGGIGIVLVTVAGAYLAAPSKRLVPLLVTATLIAAMSFIDDLKSLSAAVRFPLQALAGAALVGAYGAAERIEFFRQWQVAAAVAVPLTVIWIAGVTNAYNFMDGIDGIAGAQAAVAGTIWYIIERRHGDYVLAALALCLVGGAIGFLIHNWPPATLFMGDVGSAFLGLTFAAFAILDRSRATAPVVAFMVIFPFLFDAAFTLLRRARRRERLWKAHRSHLYQRLVIAGWTHRATALLYAAVAAADGGAALLVDRRSPNCDGIALAVLLLSAALLVSATWWAERRASRRR